MTKEQEEQKKEEESQGVSRREFLKDAGLVVGGATVGSISILSACKDETIATKTVTVTSSGGTTTTTVISPGGTATTSVTSPPLTKVVEVTATGFITLNVNGENYQCVVKPEWSLAYVLREKLRFTGTKRGCDNGDCGVCTVIMDGHPVLSCIVIALEASGKPILTVEGLSKNSEKLHPLQQAFIDNNAMECGFCVPGQLMTAKALLDFKPKPTVDEIKECMAGTLCRCGVYNRVIKSIQAVAK